MVKIRLQRHGNKNRPFYRLIVADSRFRRDGRFIEILGYYDPLRDPAKIQVNQETVKKWVSWGAQPTSSAKSLLNKVMDNFFDNLEKERRLKIQAKRKKRKERAAAANKASAV